MLTESPPTNSLKVETDRRGLRSNNLFVGSETYDVLPINNDVLHFAARHCTVKSLQLQTRQKGEYEPEPKTVSPDSLVREANGHVCRREECSGM
jgi:hypothetical protein